MKLKPIIQAIRAGNPPIFNWQTKRLATTEISEIYNVHVEVIEMWVKNQ